MLIRSMKRLGSPYHSRTFLRVAGDACGRTVCRRLRPLEETLGYWYNLPEADAPLPGMHQSKPKYRIPRLAWRLVPLVLQAHVGPFLIQGGL